MLLATTVMLLVFRAPSATISVMWLISAKMFVNEKPPFPLRKFHSIANLCATTNAATTFIMFIIYGTKFRSEFKRIYCSCWKKSETQTTTTILIKPEDQQQMKIDANETTEPIRSSQNTTRTTNASLGSMRYQCSSMEREENPLTRSIAPPLAILEDDEENKSLSSTFSWWNFFQCR